MKPLTHQQLVESFVREVQAAAARGEDCARYVDAHLQAAVLVAKAINVDAGALLERKILEAQAITIAALQELKARSSTVG